MKAQLFINYKLRIYRFGSISTKLSKCSYYYCGCRRTLNCYSGNNYIYFDVPKCASQKVRRSLNILGNHLNWDNTLYFLQNVVDDYGDYEVHGKYSSLLKKYIDHKISNGAVKKPEFQCHYENLQDTSEQYSFAFVRNPYDRFLSSYNMFSNPDNNNRKLLKYHLFGKETLSIIEYLDYIKRNPKGNCHWMPMSSFIPEDESINTFKLENFSEAWRRICSMLNINFNSNYVNKSEKEITELPGSLKKEIGQIYKNDFKRFNYKT